MTTLRELHEARSRSIASMRALTDNPAGDGDLSAEQAETFDKLKAEVTNVEARIARQTYLDECDRRAQGTTISGGNGDDKFNTELRSFSLLKAIAAGVPDMRCDAGREREISAELQRRSGRAHSGITCPIQCLETRTQQANVATAGGFLSPEIHRGDLFVDALRPRLLTGRLGATILSDLSGGTVTIPTRTGSATAYWVAEDQVVTLSDGIFGQLRLVPKTIGARTEVTRDLLMQSSPSIEQLVRSDFAEVIAKGIDTAALSGSGIGAEPKCLLNATGIGTFNLATVSYANVLTAIEDIETANATATGWATNPHVVKVLMSTVKVSGDTTGNFIMPDPNSLAGFPLVSSTLVPANVGAGSTKSALIFGNWADLMIGYWGSFDLLVNPYESTAYSKGNVQVRALLTCDVAVRRLLSFTAATDVV